MNPDDLIEQADDLLRRSPRRPKQADLRRAVSAAYYAVFHALCAGCADSFVGAGAKRKLPAWALVYRSVGHHDAKERCNNLGPLVKARGPGGLERRVQRFAVAFTNLQAQRHRADYDPHARFTRSGVEALVTSARRALEGFGAVDAATRRDFAAHVLFRFR